MSPKPMSTRSAAEPDGVASLLAHENARWTQAGSPRWRDRELASPWPHDLLVAFSLRMAAHGMSISRALMLSDRRYALQQLVHAHSLDDAALCGLAVQLFRHFEARRPVRARCTEGAPAASARTLADTR